MGLIGHIMTMIFGGNRNVVVETAEVFRANAERSEQRAAEVSRATLQQFAAEFAHPRRGIFDRLIDGINRLPRPLLAIGTIALFVSAMFDPIWFASRMQGIALVPDPLWWLMGAIVSFYFGARHQAHSQDFQRSIAQTMARVPTVIENTAALEALAAPSPQTPQIAKIADEEGTTEALSSSNNPALADWSRQKSWAVQ